jgi:hypothetical protein
VDVDLGFDFVVFVFGAFALALGFSSGSRAILEIGSVLFGLGLGGLRLFVVLAQSLGDRGGGKRLQLRSRLRGWRRWVDLGQIWRTMPARSGLQSSGADKVFDVEEGSALARCR